MIHKAVPPHVTQHFKYTSTYFDKPQNAWRDETGPESLKLNSSPPPSLPPSPSPSLIFLKCQFTYKLFVRVQRLSCLAH